MFSNPDFTGLVLFIAGLLIRFLIGRRRFKRRNVAGLQVFPGYLAALIITTLELLANLLGFILILAGLVFMLF